MDKQSGQEEQAMQKIKQATQQEVWIWWSNKTYKVMVQEILANYTQDDEDFDLKILVVLQSSYGEVYDDLKGWRLQEKYPED